jgi:hypothetical protein
MGNSVYNRIKKALYSLLLISHISHSPAFSCTGIYRWIVKLFISWIQMAKQVEYFIFNIFDSSCLPIHLVDHHDWKTSFSKGLFENELCLSHRTFSCAYNQAHSINHIHDSFNLPSKICMSRCIDNIKLMIVVNN